MSVHKQYVNEWKSINDSTKKLSEYISKMIWNISSEQTDMKLDRVLYVPFLSGEFDINLNDILVDNAFGIDSLNVVYYLYFYDDVYRYNKDYAKIGNSSYDNDTNTLTVKGGIIEGCFNFLITQEIWHELNHAFEYGNGLHKREELYSIVSKVMTNNQSSEIEKIVSRLLYYTFPHEQDAFVHQFYGLLSSQGIRGKFDELIMKYTHYSSFITDKSRYSILKKDNKNNVKEVIQEFGMKIPQFEKRIHFAKKRLYRKLRSAYERYVYKLSTGNAIDEAKRLITTDVIILNKLSERYPNIKYDDKDYKWF